MGFQVPKLHSLEGKFMAAPTHTAEEADHDAGCAQALLPRKCSWHGGHRFESRK
jgi:hypothetical protein